MPAGLVPQQNFLSHFTLTWDRIFPIILRCLECSIIVMEVEIGLGPIRVGSQSPRMIPEPAAVVGKAASNRKKLN